MSSISNLLLPNVVQYKDENNLLEEQEFYDFLNKITAFIWMYAKEQPILWAALLEFKCSFIHRCVDSAVFLSFLKIMEQFMVVPTGRGAVDHHRVKIIPSGNPQIK